MTASAPTALPPPRRSAAVPVRRTLTPREPRTTAARALELGRIRIAQGDPALRETRDAQAALLQADNGLLWRLVRSYSGRGTPDDDLFQAACLGYLKGVQRYDPASGNALATYALWWARVEVQDCLADDAVTLIPRATRFKLLKLSEAGNQRAQEWLRLLQPVSLEEPGDDGRPQTSERLTCPLPRPDALVEEDSTVARVEALLAAALATLTPRELDVVKRRLLADVPEALEDIGASYDLTRERVRQIEATALGKLRGHFARYATDEDREALDLDARRGPPVGVKAWRGGNPSKTDREAPADG